MHKSFKNPRPSTPLFRQSQSLRCSGRRSQAGSPSSGILYHVQNPHRASGGSNVCTRPRSYWRARISSQSFQQPLSQTDPPSLQRAVRGFGDSVSFEGRSYGARKSEQILLMTAQQPEAHRSTGAVVLDVGLLWGFERLSSPDQTFVARMGLSA